jgi:hypothetical protein
MVPIYDKTYLYNFSTGILLISHLSTYYRNTFAVETKRSDLGFVVEFPTVNTREKESG